MVVALARTRLTKMRVLAQCGSRGLREGPPEGAFHPVGEIPPEALSYLEA